ncbi:hypothetical protein [Miniphocaeibacter halophilus]|uniref:Uncharacterized protein n=1 Tax=Miniphocaeibacter halophilus TaxID=2931922 RepID=A0AC61MUB0_9FIRM|nr:hypothetical protein [Miniphocaeibacter halophilus]QQK08953.1 hypothetical protein JFY71_05295 [Miniphocaeibacter halophilus]
MIKKNFKLSFVLLILLLAFTLTACKNNTKEEINNDLSLQWNALSLYPSSGDKNQDGMIAGHTMQIFASDDDSDNKEIIKLKDFKKILKKDYPDLLEAYENKESEIAEIIIGLEYDVKDSNKQYVRLNLYENKDYIIYDAKMGDYSNIEFMYLFNNNENLIIVHGGFSPEDFRVTHGLLYNKEYSLKDWQKIHETNNK